MTKKILLGYEIESGKPVHIEPSHLIVTGVSALSGKTTTLEAVIARSGLKAVVFKTKIGERVFFEGTMIPPYFREQSDWQYVQSLLEATMKERMKFERSWIIEVCRGTSSLLDVKANIDKKLSEGKLSGLSRSVFTTLQAYFDIVLPQLQYANFSKTLELREGINIMDLERFKPEVQSLVIRSVLDEVLQKEKNIAVVVPESWKFIPQARGSPVKIAAENYIRQGAVNGNYLFIDSQDMAGIDKSTLKQVSTWILGLQTERNEVEHTLDQISLPKKSKPKPEDIMRLKLGHFILVTPETTKKVYVRPAWMDEETAISIAKGKANLENIRKPERIAPFAIQNPQSSASPQNGLEAQKMYAKVQQELVELRQDFFTKIAQQQDSFNALASQIFELKNAQPQASIEEIVSRVLQKLPVPSASVPALNEEALVQKILARVPSGGSVYQVAPLEKIKKNFLEEAKSHILSQISALDEEQKKMLKYLETQGTGQKLGTIIEKCLFKSQTSGGTRTTVSQKLREMALLEIIRMDKNVVSYPALKDTLQKYLAQHDAKPEEIQQVYNHILASML